MSTAKRAQLHIARPEDAAAVLVERLEHESEYHYAARCTSIRALGVNWIKHPAYVFDPRHSANPEVWKPAHWIWWERVHDAAERDRSVNPAFVRAQAVRNAMGPK